MGCINSKPNSTPTRPSRKGSFGKHPSRSNSSKIENLSRSKAAFDSLDTTREANLSRSKDGFGKFDTVEAKPALVEKERYGSSRYYEGEVEKKQENLPEIGFQDPTGLEKVPSVVVHPGFGRVPKASELEQVAAGWPTWLVRVAGEALVGWVPRRASTFEKSDKIGQGTYSSVFKARDLIQKKVVALKKVRFDLKDLESVKFMAREIIILRRLDHPNVIKLEGLITAPASCSLYLVFEYMEHDLVGIASLPGIKFSEPQVKCYMDQLLSGLDHCHSRGVLHRDIKGSNLLIDTNGVLKIADFGLATFFDPNNSVPLTSRVVTLWYRPPELLLGASHYGVGVDLWSAGCILGELYASKPILPGKTEVEQLHRIFKLCGSPSEDYWRKLKLTPSAVFKPVQQYRRRIAETFKDFPDPVLSLMETLLSIDPEDRGTAENSLKSEFFTTEPFACDPASLPKYPPSKEIDAKLREEARSRSRAAGERVENPKLETRGSKEPPALKTNAAFTSIMQKKQYPESLKSRCDIFNSSKGERVSGFPVNSSRPTQNFKDVVRKDSMPMERNVNKIYHSGPLVNNRKMGRSICLKEHVPSRTVASKATAAEVPVRVSSNADRQERRNPLYAGPNEAEMDRGSYYRSDSFGPQNEQNWNKIYMSGPLMVQPKKVDQMLEEHDRQLQEFARQARRNDKARPGKV